MCTALALSLVIPTHDEEELLGAALQSLAAQDYPSAAVEIIVVDDASPRLDETSLRTAAAPLCVQIIRQQRTQGRARTRNAGIRAARGEVIVFLDADMSVDGEFLRAHAALHRALPHAVGIGQVRFAPQVGSPSMARYIEGTGIQRLKPGQAVPFRCFATGNASVRRRHLVQAGLFDQEFRAYGGEDLELGYRLHLQGATFHYIPQARSLHHRLRSLEQTCQLMHTYGRHSLPLLVHKHPELAKLLRLDFLEESLFSPRRLLWSLALLPPLYHPIRRLVQWTLERRAPRLFFDYLFWYHRTRGYLEARDSRRGGQGNA